jgi:putative transcriptional regulator
MAPDPAVAPGDSLAALRRSGTVTELMFLYECATLEPTQFKPIAHRLGLTVQAVSHIHGQLTRRGYVEYRNGRYRPTVRGVAWLHEALGGLGEDVRARLDRLQVVRSTRAIALTDLAKGDPVSIELRDGLLSASAGREGASRGRVTKGARRGALVTVSELEGIVPLLPATVSVRTLSEDDLEDPVFADRLRTELDRKRPGLLGAQGLEAFHAIRLVTDRPIQRFAVAASSREASQLGVPSTIFVLESELPRLLASFAEANPPPLEVSPLPRLPRRRRRGPRGT